MSRQQNKNNSDNKTSNRSQRRLALAVLVIILAVSVFFLSDNSAISGLRDRIFGGSEVTDTADQNDQYGESESAGQSGSSSARTASIDGNSLPEFNGSNYVALNGNVPEFPEEVYEAAGLVSNGKGSWKTEGTVTGVDSRKLTPYEFYGELDRLGRCTIAYGCLGDETMPPDGVERGDISSIHPTGWLSGQHWERCHLIAWALSNENANDRNLVTGTHYLNNDGMRPLEEEVEHYIWDTGNHVLYMTVPIFSGDEQICRGVQMAAWSIEDGGKGISFNVYCFNVTPGADIDYYTGVVTTEEQYAQDARDYVINMNTGVFHYPSCDGAKSMSKKNRKEVHATRYELTSQGYTPCGMCEP